MPFLGGKINHPIAPTSAFSSISFRKTHQSISENHVLVCSTPYTIAVDMLTTKVLILIEIDVSHHYFMENISPTDSPIRP